MNENNKNGLFIMALTLSIGLIISVLILSGTMKQIKYSDHFVTVKGFAEKKIISDYASWHVMIGSDAKDLNTAYQKLENNRNIVVNYLMNSGIKQNQISFSSIQSTKTFKKDKDGIYLNEVDAYNLSRQVYVNSKDVYLINRLSNEITSLIQQGIEINSYPPSYFYSGLEGMKKEMISQATKEAKKRAELLAESTGSKVSGLKSAEQGVFQITAVNSNEISDYGTYDLSSIEKMIKAVVTAEFLIK